MFAISLCSQLLTRRSWPPGYIPNFELWSMLMKSMTETFGHHFSWEESKLPNSVHSVVEDVEPTHSRFSTKPASLCAMIKVKEESSNASEYGDIILAHMFSFKYKSIKNFSEMWVDKFRRSSYQRQYVPIETMIKQWTTTWCLSHMFMIGFRLQLNTNCRSEYELHYKMRVDRYRSSKLCLHFPEIYTWIVWRSGKISSICTSLSLIPPQYTLLHYCHSYMAILGGNYVPLEKKESRWIKQWVGT